jgi:hypothetical protein
MMKKNITISISNSFARKILSHWYAEAIKNYEPENLAKLIENGGLAKHPSNLAANWSAGSVAQLLGDLNLGEPIAVLDYYDTEQMASSVFVEVSSGNFISIWDLENIAPKERQERIQEYNQPKWNWFRILFQNEKNADILPPFSKIASQWSTEEKIKYCRKKDKKWT